MMPTSDILDGIKKKPEIAWWRQPVTERVKKTIKKVEHIFWLVGVSLDCQLRISSPEIPAGERGVYGSVNHLTHNTLYEFI